jgi:hypothetical protein
MAKALELSVETLTNSQPIPRAAQVQKTGTGTKQGKGAIEAKRAPLQVRWPAEDVKAAKLAAIQLDFPTLSDFMLACFHEYMKRSKKA